MGCLLAGEVFALEAEGVAGWEFYFVSDGLLPVFDEGFEVAFIGVCADDDAALAVFAVDDVGAVDVVDVGDEGEGDVGSIGCLDEEVADFFRVCAPGFGEAEDEVDGGFAFAEFAEGGAA